MRVRAWRKSGALLASMARLPPWLADPGDRPGGRNQTAGAVRQDQNQTQPTLSMEAAEDFERLPFKRMTWPNDPDESRHLDVGSMSCRSSTRSRIVS